MTSRIADMVVRISAGTGFCGTAQSGHMHMLAIV
jgi:hypothetical protein